MTRRRMLACLGVAAATLLGAAGATPPPAQQALIDRLIGYVERQNGMVFVRNGKDHSCADAAKFLRGKLESMGGKVTTAHEFIDRIASQSSTTGEAYQVRFSDGRTLPASRFLHDELKRLEPAR